ncbi:unnamed protein product [Clonostachys byssicola]|uniref:CN hydrolase domain-containing protein n=1 Tax=Clonostachys byssicola TaxID=160290 RepID=A0A9N9UIC6_9HYPO|nr:unnamed protein product [Clonostachys byssicola]
MRIGLVQFSPVAGKTVRNIKQVDRILRESAVGQLDMLVLPEMAFSGYYFASAQDIEPYLEPTSSGHSTLWAQRVAKQLRCFVTVGYPERTTTSPVRRYSSCVVVSDTGEVVANYRKSSLYFQDETWAEEGEGFFAGEMQKLGQVAIGICMDLNPYQFRAAWSEFEFARHVVRHKARLVLMPLAWVTVQDPAEFDKGAGDPDKATLDYWIRRFEPVAGGNGIHGGEETVVVLANRCGREADNLYAGTSCVLGFGGGEPHIYAVASRSSVGLVVADTSP